MSGPSRASRKTVRGRDIAAASADLEQVTGPVQALRRKRAQFHSIFSALPGSQTRCCHLRPESGPNKATLASPTLLFRTSKQKVAIRSQAQSWLRACTRESLDHPAHLGLAGLEAVCHPVLRPQWHTRCKPGSAQENLCAGPAKYLSFSIPEENLRRPLRTKPNKLTEGKGGEGSPKVGRSGQGSKYKSGRRLQGTWLGGSGLSPYPGVTTGD